MMRSIAVMAALAAALAVSAAYADAGGAPKPTAATTAAKVTPTQAVVSAIVKRSGGSTRGN